MDRARIGKNDILVVQKNNNNNPIDLLQKR